MLDVEVSGVHIIQETKLTNGGFSHRDIHRDVRGREREYRRVHEVRSLRGISRPTRVISRMLTKEFTDGFCHKDPAGLEVEHFSMRGGQVGVMKLVTYLLGKVDDPDWVNNVMRKRTRREKERRTEGDARRGRVHGSGGGEGRKEEMC